MNLLQLQADQARDAAEAAFGRAGLESAQARNAAERAFERAGIEADRIHEMDALQVDQARDALRAAFEREGLQADQAQAAAEAAFDRAGMESDRTHEMTALELDRARDEAVQEFLRQGLSLDQAHDMADAQFKRQGIESDRGYDLADRGQLLNEAQIKYGQEMALRQQLAQEMMTERDRPFQEAQALMGMAPPPGMPQFTPVSQYQINPPDYLGASAAAQQAAAQRHAGTMGMMGQGIGAIGKIAAKSDIRLKENIREVGKTNSGLPIYTYNYIGDSLTHMGVMAQEVEKVIPEAVLEDSDGYKSVLYGMIN